MVSSSSAMPAETSRAPKGTCTRSTPRPARLCGNSSSCPRPRAMRFAGLRAPRRLYGFDLADDKLLYRTPVTRIENVEEPFAVDKDVHFCPGAAGGGEWNSPAYDPLTNLIFTGDVDWCVTVRLQTREEIAADSLGQPWTGEKSFNPFNEFGKFTRADRVWAGWLHAVDADTGVWKWRLKSNYPIFSGVTPTAGG